MLSANQRRALAAQLSSPNRRAAAKACGLSESALVKYSQNPEYRAALDAGRDAQMQEAIHSLNACTAAAVDTLRQIVDNPKAQDMAKIAAARALLEFALRFTESAGAAAVPAVVIVDDLPELGKAAPPGAPLAEISREGGETDGNETQRTSRRLSVWVPWIRRSRSSGRRSASRRMTRLSRLCRSCRCARPTAL